MVLVEDGGGAVEIEVVITGWPAFGSVRMGGLVKHCVRLAEALKATANTAPTEYLEMAGQSIIKQGAGVSPDAARYLSHIQRPCEQRKQLGRGDFIDFQAKQDIQGFQGYLFRLPPIGGPGAAGSDGVDRRALVGPPPAAFRALQAAGGELVSVLFVENT